MRQHLKNHHEVAHAWANKTQSSGEASHMFFDGDSLFSYGRHFEIARHMPNGVILFNSRSYSSSTNKHQSRARQAINHKTVFYVPSMTDHAENAEYYLKEIAELHEQALRARSNAEWKKECLENKIAAAGRYCATFKAVPKALRNDLLVWYQRMESETLFTDEQRAKMKEKMRVDKERKAKENEARNEREALREKEAQEKLAAWVSGTRSELPPYTYGMQTLLRIKDGWVETTRGARVRLKSALVLYRALCNSAADGLDLVGHKIYGFEVSRVDNESIVIGCHVIPRSELDRLNATLSK